MSLLKKELCLKTFIRYSCLFHKSFCWPGSVDLLRKKIRAGLHLCRWNHMPLHPRWSFGHAISTTCQQRSQGHVCKGPDRAAGVQELSPSAVTRRYLPPGRSSSEFTDERGQAVEVTPSCQNGCKEPSPATSSLPHHCPCTLSVPTVPPIPTPALSPEQHPGGGLKKPDPRRVSSQCAGCTVLPSRQCLMALHSPAGRWDCWWAFSCCSLPSHKCLVSIAEMVEC